MLEYIRIILGVTGFGLQHSGISSTRIKSRIIDNWGKKGYSLIYSGTSLFMIWVAIRSINYTNWLYFLDRESSLNLGLFVIGLFMIIIGLIIAIISSQVISVTTIADMRSERQDKLEMRGIYGKIRHPLYLASIVLTISLAFIYPFPRIWVFSITFSIYILIGTYLEEQKLIQHYGHEYLDYKKRVGALIPKL